MRYHQGFATALVAWGSVAGAAQAAAPTVKSFSPASGTIDTPLIITGTNFTGATKVTIDGVAAKFSVTSATQIKATTPATATGPVAVTSTGGTGASTTNFSIVPGAVIAPTIAPPGASITVTGAGFATYGAIDVYVDTVDTALAVSNGLGVATATLTLPTGAAPGQHWITLVERINGLAAQAKVTVNTNWIEDAFSAPGHAFNAYEATLGTGNVSQLDTAWINQDSLYGNVAPLVEYNGVVFNGNVEGVVKAYSSTGAIQWTANPGVQLTPLSPVVAAGYVIFASGSKLFAYKVNCASGGKTCTPAWTATLPVSVGAGLSYFGTSVYVPGGDGQVYPVSPATGAIGTPFYAYDNTHGAINTPVHFAADGSFFYGAGLTFQGRYPSGSTFEAGTNGHGFSAGAVLGTTPYYMDSTGLLRQGAFGWSVALPGGPGCLSNVAIAYGLVFAGSCNSIGAYSAGTGALAWSVSTPGAVSGIAVANNVMYACINYTLYAYYATYGELLWSGGDCGATPIVANGTLYAFNAHVSAWTVNGASPLIATRRPVPVRLTPDYRIAPQRTPDAPR